MIWALLILGLILRVISLDQSLWLDEAINVLAAKNYSITSIITEYSKADFHPPGFFIILWAWSKIFGYSELAVRAPSVIFGLITIYLSFLIGQKLHSKKLGLLAALVLSVNPLHLYYSQEARMYSFATMAVALNILFFIKLIRNEKLSSSGFLLSMFLVLSSDYVAYLIVPAELIVIGLLKSIRVFRKWLILNFLSACVWIWWLPFFLAQVALGSQTAANVPIWKEIVGSFGLKPLVLTYIKFIIGRISHPNDLVYLALFAPAGLLFSYLIFKALGHKNTDTKNLLLTLVSAPILLAWLISIFLPIYSYFRLLFALPTFLILVSLGAMQLNKKFRFFTITLLILVQLTASLIYLLNPTFQREDWKGLVGFLKIHSANSLILFESNGVFSPFEYYSGNSLRAMGSLKRFPAVTEEDIINMEHILESETTVYLLDYLVEISDPDRVIAEKLTNLGFVNLETYNFNGVGFLYKYSRK